MQEARPNKSSLLCCASPPTAATPGVRTQTRCKTAKFILKLDLTDLPGLPAPLLGIDADIAAPRAHFQRGFLSQNSSLLPIQLAATRAGSRFSTEEDGSQRYICITLLQQGLQSQLSDALDTPVMLFMNLKMHTGFNTLSPSLSVSMWKQFNTIRQDRKLTPFYRINCIQVVGQDKETPGQRAGWPKARHHLQISVKLVRILQGGKAFPKGIASCYRSTQARGK